MFQIGKRSISIELLMRHNHENNGYRDYESVRIYRRQEHEMDEKDDVQVVLRDYFNLIPTLGSIEISARLKVVDFKRSP